MREIVRRFIKILWIYSLEILQLNKYQKQISLNPSEASINGHPTSNVPQTKYPRYHQSCQ